tara:strand:- start:5 stop:322 length:318 start_codon:yes stop_codon:yes gene_type:complete
MKFHYPRKRQKIRDPLRKEKLRTHFVVLKLQREKILNALSMKIKGKHLQFMLKANNSIKSDAQLSIAQLEPITKQNNGIITRNKRKNLSPRNPVSIDLSQPRDCN